MSGTTLRRLLSTFWANIFFSAIFIFDRVELSSVR